MSQAGNRRSRPRATLLIVGSEMTDPRRGDANGPFAREALGNLGVEVAAVHRVGDDVADLREAFRCARLTSDIVLASGGLGPTGDDLTRDGLAELLGRSVVEDPAWAAALEERLRARGKGMSDLARRQALIVQGSEALPNEMGLACGGWVEEGGRVFALLPGVPREFRDILDNQVLPRLQRRFTERPETLVVRATVAGLPEVEAEPVLAPWYGRDGLEVSILPSLGVLKISFRLTRPPCGDLEGTVSEIRSCLEEGFRHHLVSLEGDSLSEALGRGLLDRSWTLAVGESCTGGLLSRKVVSVSGASRYFLGSVTAYANEAKMNVLGVPRGIIERFGAVSEETALAMVRGVRARFNASCGVATTGVAGPAGGTPEKPVGTVWIAAGTPEGERAMKVFFPLDRASVMELSSNYALYTLWRMVHQEKG